MLETVTASMTSVLSSVLSSLGVSLGGVTDRAGDPGSGWCVLAVGVLAAVIGVMVVRTGGVED